MTSSSTQLKFEVEDGLPEDRELLIQERLGNMSKYQLEPERSRNLNTMIIGNWDFTQHKVIVSVCKGNHLDTMGVRGRVDTLFAEEMLFLVEKSRLCLVLPTASPTPPTDPSSPTAASVEECYQLLLDSGVLLEEYLVYSHLKSLGNVLFRRGVISHELASLSCTELDSLLSTSLTACFEVWTPTAKFTRKSPPPPSFLLLIDAGPESSRLKFLESSILIAKSVKLAVKIAVVVEGEVTFFNHSVEVQ